MLAAEPFYFQRATSWLDELSNSVGGGSAGVTVTAGASNTMGSTVTALGPLSHDTHLLTLQFAGFYASAVAHHVIADILADPAGGTSWDTTIAESLMVGFSYPLTNGQGGAPIQIALPIWQPAGTTIGVRAQTSHSSSIDGKVLATSFGDPSMPGAWWCGRAVETIGVSRATSKGVSVTPGASSSWSSWTDIGSPTAYRWRSAFVTSNGTDADSIGGGLRLSFGEGGVKFTWLPDLLFTISITEHQMRLTPPTPIFCDLAAGTQIQARGMFTGASVEAANVAVHGVY